MTTTVKRIKHDQAILSRASAVSVFALSGLLHGLVLADGCPSGQKCTIDDDSMVTVENGENRSFPDWLEVGALHKGTLNINTEGVVNVENNILVGRWSNSEGHINVDGSGSRLESGSDLNVGIAGTGRLTISGGAHVITGGNAKIGHRANGNGIAIVHGTGSRWEISSHLRVGDNEFSGGTAQTQGALTISEGGVVSVGSGSSGSGTVYVGILSGATGTINTGAAADDTAIAGGTLKAGEVVFGAGTGALVFNHTANDTNTLEFAPAIKSTSSDGSSTIDHHSGHTSLTGDSSEFIGTITISGGTLAMLDTGRLGSGSDLSLAGSDAAFNLANSNRDQSIGTLSGIAGSQILLGDRELITTSTSDTTFAGTISGSADSAFSKAGAGVLQLTGDSSGFLGTTTISGGTLSVGGAHDTGKLGGTLHVENGGTLAGTGTVGGGMSGGAASLVTVASGGTIAPGNSIGTLTVDGNLTFEAESRYHVEVDPQGTQSDHIHVTGTATLDGGSVVHIGADGSYRPQASYRILTADTGLTGAFGDVSSSYAFLTPTLEYDYSGYTVDLTLLRNDTRFDALARTPNQVATAQGLESLPQSSALLQHVLTLPDDTPAATFDALSGEVHASTASALHLGSTTARALPLARLRTNLNAGMRPGALLAQAGSAPVPAAALPQSAALPLWAQVVGNWQRLDGDDNAGDLKQTTHGLFVGGDHAIGAGWRLGAALGYTDSRLRVRDRDSKADVNTYSVTLYGGKAFELGRGQFNLLAGTAYSRHNIKTSRQATLGDWNHTLKADYHAHTQQVFGELGYAVPVGRATVEPFAGLAWTELRTRRFSESGGPTALAGQRQRDATTTSTLGLRASTDLELGKTQGRVYASVGWRHAFGRVTPQSTLRFDGGQPFTVAGTPIARDSAVLELGADIAVSPNAQMGLAYNGQLGHGSRDHAASINVQWRF